MEKMGKATPLAVPESRILSGKNLPALLQKRVGGILLKAVVYFILIELVYVFAFPFLFMIIVSLKYDYELLDISRQWVLTSLNFDNYTEAIQSLSYGKSLVNSLGIVLFSTLGHILSCSFVAYGFARYRFRFRNLLFGLVLFTLIVPPQLMIMPLYIQYSNFGWMGSRLPIIVPSFFGMGLKGGLFIFLYRQFFKSLPVSYEEAAKLEGCGPLRLYFQIMFPLVKTGTLVVAILSLVWHWNDYFEPMTYLKGNQMMLTQMLSVMQNSAFSVTAASGAEISTVAMAGGCLTILPVLVLYFIFQKQFMQGIEMAGLAN